MRNLLRTVTLALIALAALLVPAAAQTADPLGLIGTGAVVPFHMREGHTATLVLASPVGSNAPPEESVDGPRPLHMLFFNAACNRSGPSVGLPMTTNDVEDLELDNISGIPKSGLIAIASADDSGFNLLPLSNPIHARVLWANAERDFVRTLEPIALHNAEASDTTQVWNPLRTGASFRAALESASSRSTLVLVCPTRNIVTGAFPSPPFPELLPAPVVSGSTPLHLRVYDDDEHFLRDVETTCRCFTQLPLSALTTVYGDALLAPRGTYTEISGGASALEPYSFTGYLAVRGLGRDSFARLHGASASSLQGTLVSGDR